MEERGTLRSYIEILAGVSEVSRERAERIVAQLAARGQLRARDIQKATRDLMERSQRNRREFARLVQKEVQRQLRTPAAAEGEPDASEP